MSTPIATCPVWLYPFITKMLEQGIMADPTKDVEVLHGWLHQHRNDLDKWFDQIYGMLEDKLTDDIVRAADWTAGILIDCGH